MLKKIQLTNRNGFTIVELLIVVVVIAILAAITIVAYGGITLRAQSSAAKSNAESVMKVTEAYAADGANSGYPTLANLNAYNGLSKIPAGVTLTAAALVVANDDGKTIQYTPKGTTGACIGYWDAVGNAPAWLFAGNAVSATNVPACS